MKKQSLIAMVLLLSATLSQAAEPGLETEQSGLAAFGAGLDSFMSSIFGWFVDLIFFSVPIGGASFPLIAGWLLVAALILPFILALSNFAK